MNIQLFFFLSFFKASCNQVFLLSLLFMFPVLFYSEVYKFLEKSNFSGLFE